MANRSSVKVGNMLRRTLRHVAILTIIGTLIAWAVLGADRGWSKTSVTTMQTDAVTGLEFPTIIDRFVPGVDFLFTGVLAGVVLLGLTFLPFGQSSNK